MNIDFLRQAIGLSIDKMKSNEGGPFGAIIVQDGQIVGRGWNRVTSANDPTAHAEIVAIRNSCSRLNAFSLSGCEIYCSCEPCPMCLAAIYWSRIDRIFFAASSDDAGAAGFDDQNFYGELGLSASDRPIPMEQALRDEACIVLQAWLKKKDRVPY